MRTSQGMVPHGATLCVLCLKCPSTWGHPRTSRGWSHMGLPYVSYVSSVPVLGDIPGHPRTSRGWSHMGLCVLCLKCPPVLGDIPGHPEDGPTWGYPMCPMSQVSQYLGTSQDIPGHPEDGPTWGYVSYVSSVPQYLGTSQDIPRMVPHGATLCVLCLKCPSTWGHPRTSQGMVPHGATLCVLCLKCPPVLGDIPGHPEDGPTWGYPMCPMSQVSQYLGTSQDTPRMVPHGATYVLSVPVLGDIPGHPGDGPSWGNPGYILSCSLAETADEVITSAQY